MNSLHTTTTVLFISLSFLYNNVNCTTLATNATTSTSSSRPTGNTTSASTPMPSATVTPSETIPLPILSPTNVTVDTWLYYTSLQLKTRLVTVSGNASLFLNDTFSFHYHQVTQENQLRVTLIKIGHSSWQHHIQFPRTRDLQNFVCLLNNTFNRKRIPLPWRIITSVHLARGYDDDSSTRLRVIEQLNISLVAVPRRYDPSSWHPHTHMREKSRVSLAITLVGVGVGVVVGFLFGLWLGIRVLSETTGRRWQDVAMFVESRGPQ